jgi:subtilisin family serine protease
MKRRRYNFAANSRPAVKKTAWLMAAIAAVSIGCSNEPEIKIGPDSFRPKAGKADDLLGSAGGRPAMVPNELIVKIRPGYSAQLGSQPGTFSAQSSGVSGILANFDAWTIEPVFKNAAPNGSGIGVQATSNGLDRVLLVKLANGLSSEAAAALKGDPAVEYAEPNYIYHTTASPNDPYYHSKGAWGQSYDDLYGVKKIDSLGAWNVTRGNRVIVAVIDTGLDVAHEDIQGNIWTNDKEIPENGIDDDGNGYIDDVAGWDFVNKDNDVADGNGHGTHVSGTIAAVGDNNVGVIGVAPEAVIMPLKGLSDRGGGDSATLANALIYAADNGARVINNSWGGKGASQLIEDAIKYAKAKGAVVVASAGNSADDAYAYHPAGSSSAITVAAHDHKDEPAHFTNYGMKIDVTAPGVETLSLLAKDCEMSGRSNAIVNERYLHISGTSMSGPHVAGVAALLIAKDPTLTPNQVRYILRASADDLHETGRDDKAGYGRLNAARAVSMDTARVPDLFTAISAPAHKATVGIGRVISGSVSGADLARYEIAVAPEGSSSFTTVHAGNQQVVDGKLGTLGDASTKLTPGKYTLRLRAFSQDDKHTDTLIAISVAKAKLGWPQKLDETETGYRGRPADMGGNHKVTMVDLDNDGKNEVVVSGKYTVAVWNADGTLRPGFPVHVNNPDQEGSKAELLPFHTIADIDGDKNKEIIVIDNAYRAGEGGPVIALRHDGTVAPGFPAGQLTTDTPWTMYAPVVAADLDGDGKDELIYQVTHRKSDGSMEDVSLSVLDASGKTKAGWPQKLSPTTDFPGPGRVIVADLDKNGKEEIIVSHTLVDGSKRVALSAFNADGTLFARYTFDAQYARVGQMLALQLDGRDKSPSIVIRIAENNPEVSWKSGPQKVFVFDADLTVRPGWPVGLEDDTMWINWGQIIPVDVDGDSRYEIVVSGYSKLLAFNASGKTLPGWPISPQGMYLYQNGSTITVAYFKGVNGPAFVFNNYSNLTAVDMGGQVIPGFPRQLGDKGPLGTPTIGDLEGDGAPEIAVITRDRLVFVLEAEANSEKTPSPWPMHDGTVGRTRVAAPPPKAPPTTWKRTVVMIYGQTIPGQDMLIRGGIDHEYSQRVRGVECTKENKLCAIPIRHLVLDDMQNRREDKYLDWYGSEPYQGDMDGSPLTWTTNRWPEDWGTRRTVDKDGYGYSPLNRWGHHYWLLDVMMDCSKTVNGYFELKSFISNGPGWERDISQPDTPYSSRNHMARCGQLNVFRHGQDHPVTIEPIP